MNNIYKWKLSKTIDIGPQGLHKVEFDSSFPLQILPIQFTLDHHFTPNFHDYLEIVYVYDGLGCVELSNRHYPIGEGDVIVIGGNELHTFLSDNNRPLKVITVYFLSELLYRPGESLLNFEYIRFFFHRRTDFKNVIPSEKLKGNQIGLLLNGLYEIMEIKDDFYKLLAKTQLCRLLLCILPHFKCAGDSDNQYYHNRMREIEKLKPVFRYIHSNFMNRISLKEAASQAGMSIPYFCRNFKKVTGNAYTEYIQRLRIDNLSYFYRLFKKYTGHNPGQFIRALNS